MLVTGLVLAIRRHPGSHPSSGNRTRIQTLVRPQRIELCCSAFQTDAITRLAQDALLVEVTLVVLYLLLKNPIVSGRMLHRVTVGTQQDALRQLLLDSRPALVSHASDVELLLTRHVMELKTGGALVPAALRALTSKKLNSGKLSSLPAHLGAARPAESVTT